MNPFVNDTNLFIVKDKFLLRIIIDYSDINNESELASYSYYIN